MAEEQQKINYIYPQSGPQAALISCPCDEIFYGGARGGGKSYGILIDWLVHEKEYGKHARGGIFRRTMPELEDMQDKALQVFSGRGATYRDQKKTWSFPSGASLKMRYLDRDQDAQSYQGHEFSAMYYDEAGNWPSPEPLDKLRACLRSSHGVRPRMILTGNPGGPGHNWLKSRFIDPCPPYEIQKINIGGEVRTRVFIPSRVSDNHKINQAEYTALLQQAGPEWLVRAWLDGDWDVIAGGALDDLWRRDNHVVQPFKIPDLWSVDRSFDWGSSKPFAVCWWAESDGTPAIMADGEQMTFPAGTLFLIHEFYGWNGKPNEGCRMLNAEIAREVISHEEGLNQQGIKRVFPGPADSSIFDTIDGRRMVDEFIRYGVNWTESNKAPGSRVAGLEAIRSRLKASIQEHIEEPGLFVFDTCTHFIRTVPVLPRDTKKPDDVSTDAEDHIYDAVRYRLFARRYVSSGVKNWK